MLYSFTFVRKIPRPVTDDDDDVGSVSCTALNVAIGPVGYCGCVGRSVSSSCPRARTSPPAATGRRSRMPQT